MSSTLASSATSDDEIAVAQILLDLKKLVSLSDYLSDFNWGCRRRRSCLDEDPPLPPAPSHTQTEIQLRKNQIEAAEVAAVAAAEEKSAAGATSSPNTPFSFSPSESDEKKSKHSSKKRSREEYMSIIEGFVKSRESLRGGIEKVKKYYDKLKTYNSELKAMKKKMLNKEEYKEHYQIHMVPHQQPYITDPTVQQILRHPIGPIQTRLCPSNNEAVFVDRVGPLGIDLNYPAVEALEVGSSQPLDEIKALADQRARCAEARMKRRGMMKAKSMRGNNVSKNCKQLSDNYESGVL